MSHTPSPHAAHSSQRASLAAVLVATFCNSLASGVAYNGIYFITDNAYGFTNQMQLYFGLVTGVTYIIGSLSAGPAMRAIQRVWPSLSIKRLLIGLLLVMTATYMIPVTAWFAAPATDRRASVLAVWVFMAIYSILCGVLWPVMESFLAGGRGSHSLRAAIGKFNITWSSSLIGSMLLISWIPGALIYAWSLAGHKLEPFDATIASLAVAASLHIISLAAIWHFPAKPAAHLHEDGHVTPANYPQLLAVHRALLPTSYMVMYVLLPLFPSLFRSVGVEGPLASTLTGCWLAARVVAFFILDRWHGWHGTWITATAGTVLILVGFALAFTASLMGGFAVAALLCGIVLFGFGVASIYFAALYYGMEVGAAQVDAGGAHEALIGVGYTAGPLIGLGAMWLAGPVASSGPSAAEAAESISASQNTATVAIVTVAAGVGVGISMWVGVRAGRTAARKAGLSKSSAPPAR